MEENKKEYDRCGRGYDVSCGRYHGLAPVMRWVYSPYIPLKDYKATDFLAKEAYMGIAYDLHLVSLPVEVLRIVSEEVWGCDRLSGPCNNFPIFSKKIRVDMTRTNK